MGENVRDLSRDSSLFGLLAETIQWGSVYLENATDEQCSSLAAVGTLKSIHRMLGGMAIHADVAKTRTACRYVISLVETQLALARVQLEEVSDDDT